MPSSNRGTPMRSSISPRKVNFRRISSLVAGNTEGISHRLVSRGSSSAISLGILRVEGAVPVALL